MQTACDDEAHSPNCFNSALKNMFAAFPEEVLAAVLKKYVCSSSDEVVAAALKKHARIDHLQISLASFWCHFDVMFCAFLVQVRNRFQGHLCRLFFGLGAC